MVLGVFFLFALFAKPLTALQASIEVVRGESRYLDHPHRYKSGAAEQARAKTMAGKRAEVPTLPPDVVTGAPHTAAEASGVAGNGALDGYAFITATITNSVMICIFVGVFMFLRRRYPMTYQNNLHWKPVKTEKGDDGQVIVLEWEYDGFAPTKVLSENGAIDINNKDKIEENLHSTWGWWNASMNTTTEEVAETAGLDMAMLLEFCNLGMHLLWVIGLPMMCIIGPMNCALGGQPAWAIGDYLSSWSFGNVENGSPLYWVHCFVVWYVVIVIQRGIYGAQGKFLDHRFAWLRRMADIRANTVLVEGIPDKYRQDGKLHEFFSEIFGKENIKEAKALENHSELEKKVAEHRNALKLYDESVNKWDQNQIADKEDAEKNQRDRKDPNELKPKSLLGKDLIEQYEAECITISEAIATLKEEMKQNRKDAAADRLKKLAPDSATEEQQAPTDFLKDHVVQGDLVWSGFVTFNERKYAQMAANQLYAEDKDTWMVSCPPEPNDIIWKDLQLSPQSGLKGTVVGYALVVGLYFVYLPIVIGIAQLAVSIDMGPLEAVWIGLAPTLGLQVMVAFLPTILLLIFRSFWILKADTLAQKRLQTYYFWFQIVFVVLVTAIGSDASGFMLTVFTDPLALPDLLGATMPPATHFYMNFLVLQWVTHAQAMMRHVMLFKWMGLCHLQADTDEGREEARKLSEPEDQDYYGMGSRSARFTINMVIGIVYGTLSPPINVLCYINFYLCRLFYGYLIPFAENKKPDLGGPFWVESLKHLFVANIIYCIVMFGVLHQRAEMTGFQPVTIASPALIYVIWSYSKFERQFSWEELPLPEVLPDALKKHPVEKRALEGTYVQEVYDPKPPKKAEPSL